MNAFGLDEWGERTTGFACATCGHIEHFCNYKDFVKIWPNQQSTGEYGSQESESVGHN